MLSFRRLDRFQDLEVPPEAVGLLAFLDHMEQLPDVAARRRRSYELLAGASSDRPTSLAGAHVADIGCGSGAAARELASLVAPGGSVVGVDVNEALVKVARARAAHEKVDVTFHAARAEALPFAEGSLQGYRAERLYQHLPSPAEAFSEARRVLAPGGRIVLVDQDWDTFVLDSDDVPTTRAMLRAAADAILDGGIGRKYHRLLRDAGFSDVRVEVEAAASTSFDDYGHFADLIAVGADVRGVVPSATVQAWLADQKARGETGRFFIAMTHFLATARR